MIRIRMNSKKVTKKDLSVYPGNVNSLSFHPSKGLPRKYLLDQNLNAPKSLKAYFLRRRWFRDPTNDPFEIGPPYTNISLFLSLTKESQKISECNFISLYHGSAENYYIYFFFHFYFYFLYSFFPPQQDFDTKRDRTTAMRNKTIITLNHRQNQIYRLRELNITHIHTHTNTYTRACVKPLHFLFFFFFFSISFFL